MTGTQAWDSPSPRHVLKLTQYTNDERTVSSFSSDNLAPDPPTASRSFVLALLRALHLDPAGVPSRPGNREKDPNPSDAALDKDPFLQG
jgi:hypothetical protein